MAKRLIQMFLPEADRKQVEEILEGCEALGVWRDAHVPSKLVLYLVARAEEAEPLMDRAEERFGSKEGFHIVVLPVEAVLPRPDPDEEEKKTEQERNNGNGKNNDGFGLRVSREELYHELESTLGVDRVFLGMAVVSAMVAAFGLLRDDVAVIIGAMVIAPLLGPNVAMALAVTLGDLTLLRRAAITNLVGVAAVVGVAFVYGLLFSLNPDLEAIKTRSSVELGQVALALGAGVAGTLAFTRGFAGAVIGVMVAVALVPPLVVAGLLLGRAGLAEAIGAFELAAVNVVGVNVAGMLTFRLQGVRPRTWWEEERSKKATRIGLALSVGMLLLLVGAIVLTDHWELFKGLL